MQYFHGHLLATAGGESMSALFDGRVGVSGTSALELGAGEGKEVNAGKIAYKKFTDGLDIVGAGTVVYALSIGPLAQLFLRVFALPSASGGSTVVATGSPERSILQT